MEVVGVCTLEEAVEAQGLRGRSRQRRRLEELLEPVSIATVKSGRSMERSAFYILSHPPPTTEVWVRESMDAPLEIRLRRPLTLVPLRAQPRGIKQRVRKPHQ